MRFAVVRSGRVLRFEQHQRWRAVRALEAADPSVEYVQAADSCDPLKCYRYTDGAFVEVMPEPTVHDVLAARLTELQRHIDPAAAGGRALSPELETYAQRLRDLPEDGQGGEDRTVSGMLSRFPRRPTDDADPVEKLKEAAP